MPDSPGTGLGVRTYALLVAPLLLMGATGAVVLAVTFGMVVARNGGDSSEAVVVQTPVPTATPYVPSPTPDPRPDGVPRTAAAVTAPVSIGSLVAGAPDARLFYNLRCEAALLTVATTREVVYAELPCRRYWLPDVVMRPYLGRAVQIEIGAGGTMILRIFSAPGPIRFETGSIWIESR
jgi:hypothetical protein